MKFTYQPDLTCATIFDICLLFPSSLWHVAWDSSELEWELWNFKLWPLLLICILVMVVAVNVPPTWDTTGWRRPGNSSTTDLHSRWCLFIHSGNEQTKLSFCTASSFLNVVIMVDDIVKPDMKGKIININYITSQNVIIQFGWWTSFIKWFSRQKIVSTFVKKLIVQILLLKYIKVH